MTSTLQPMPPPVGRAPASRLAFTLLAVAGLLIAVATVGWVAYGSLSAAVRQESAASASYVGIRGVTVDAGSADVTITAATGGTVRYDQTLQWSFRRPSASVARTGDQLTIRVSCPLDVGWGCSVHLDLRVPAATVVRVASGSGNVSATGLSAGATLSTRDGNVTARSVRGDIDARSSDGNVTITGAQADQVSASSGDGNVQVQLDISPSVVRATSGDGNVSVLLPDQPAIAYQVSAKSGDGSRTVGVRADPSASRHVTAQSGDGNVEVRYG